MISGFSGEAIDIRDASTVARLHSGELSFGGLALANNGPYPEELGRQDDDGGFDEAQFFASYALAGNPGIAALFANDPAPNLRIAADSPLASVASTPPQGEFWDEAANYIGALKPGSTTTWLDGWTHFPNR